MKDTICHLPGSHRTGRPLILWKLASTSYRATKIPCPMCRLPVTFGGGIGSTYGDFPPCFPPSALSLPLLLLIIFASGSKQPDRSHQSYISDSKEEGSYDPFRPSSLFASSYSIVVADSARIVFAEKRENGIRVRALFMMLR